MRLVGVAVLVLACAFATILLFVFDPRTVFWFGVAAGAVSIALALASDDASMLLAAPILAVWWCGTYALYFFLGVPFVVAIGCAAIGFVAILALVVYGLLRPGAGDVDDY